MLVLDEPTNDLDIETLELLEAELAEFPGTLLIVSHDRRFLDNVVTSTLVFEGDGVVREYVGGYDDWIRQRRPPPGAEPLERSPTPRAPKPIARLASNGRPRLSYKEKLELEQLPERIAALEAEQTALDARISGVEFYKEPAAAIAGVLSRLEQIRDELEAIYRRWDELDSRQTT